MRYGINVHERWKRLAQLFTIVTLVCFLRTGVSGGPSDSNIPELNDKTFEPLLNQILPSKKEKQWKKIGWREDLMKAVKEARALKRPILLWVMNGEPLGNL